MRHAIHEARDEKNVPNRLAFAQPQVAAYKIAIRRTGIRVFSHVRNEIGSYRASKSDLVAGADTLICWRN